MEETTIRSSINYHETIDTFIDELRESLSENSVEVFTSAQASSLLSNFVKATDDSISAQYFVPPLIKNYFILIRDSRLEFEKARFNHSQGEITKSQYLFFTDNLFSNVVSAGVFLKAEIHQQTTKKLSELEKEKMEEIISPWPTYHEQLEKIIEQIELIEDSYSQFIVTHPKLNQIIETIHEALRDAKNSFEVLNSAIGILEDLSKKTAIKVKDLYKIYKEINIDIQKISNLKINLDYVLEQMFVDLPEVIKIPISGSKGQLIIKETLLRKNIKDWIQIEILPEIYEIWELNDDLINKVKSNSDNIANRINIALTSEEEEFNSSFFVNTINRLKKDCKITIERSENLDFKILSKLNTELKTEHILSDKNLFIASSWGSAIDTSSIDESPVFKNAKKWLKNGITFIVNYVKTLFDDNEMNTYDTLIRYLKDCNRQKYSEYNSIFLTKSFSGKSFYIPRTDKHLLANQAIDNWLEGFGSGLIVKGNRYSGKTSFSNAIVNERSDIQSIELQPEKEILFKGRKFRCNYNLNEVFNFLKKHHSGDKVIIFIDDLFKWQNKQTHLISNIKALLKFINYNQSKFFIITTLDTFQLEHFDKNLNLSSTFTTQINVNQIKIDQFYKVIDVRHGATHKGLTQANGQTVNSELFKKYIKLVHREANGNIGDALRIWAMSVTELENEEMIFDLFKVVSLPDFLNEDNMIVLKAIALHRQITEYQLRNQLGPSFNNKYRDILMRLINIGLIERDLFNNLIYSENIANQLLAKLKYEGYL